MDRHCWTGTPCGYKAAREITTVLLEKGYILRIVKPGKGQSAVYCCSSSFRERLAGWQERLVFKRARPHPVEVREPKKDYWGSYKKKRLPLNRFPSDEVRRHQEIVHSLNASLSRHSLRDAEGRQIDTTLSRIFTGDLTSGGRLYGEYQRTPEADRLCHTIDGETVCEIDLKASHVAILAALYEHPERLPKDPYSAISWVKTASLRKAAKTLVQCIVHADGGRPTRFPRQDDGISFREKYELGNTNVEDMLPGVFEVMPFLDGSPCLTLTLQFIESEILVEAVRRLCCQDIPALPIHDSLLVRRLDEYQVLRILRRTLTNYLGFHAPWLDVSVAGREPRMIEPLSCPEGAEYFLQEISVDLVKYEKEDASVIDPEDTEASKELSPKMAHTKEDFF
ncbi:hypothetical protein [Roseovarius salinarum]|uniref:hypothetical protein n=1 Tax=Roseovarius salinarum TaxID=1981892 RepID=UPI000C33B700|nr:hypothetical protein [Roseovarius salinarum]